MEGDLIIKECCDKAFGHKTTCVNYKKPRVRQVDLDILKAHRFVDPKHFEVTYTSRDDGIHIRCVCGWRECLGHDPSLQGVMDSAERHTKDGCNGKRR